MKVHVKRSTRISNSPRVRQLESMFDVPRSNESIVQWSGVLPDPDDSWNIGLIVGPSGSGKSTVLGEVYGDPPSLTWGKESVVDDFSDGERMAEIAEVCQAVGFNTIPSWMRPYSVLSNGEQFRASLARMLIEANSSQVVTIDEFTSVVDRQVAQIGAHAFQKYVRANKLKFVVASCHYDIIDWLQPDWVCEMPTMQVERRLLRQRPSVDITICRVPHSYWRLFAPFHYLTAELNKSARCFCLFVDDRPASFVGILYRPHPTANDIVGISRQVTLPDWQGLGLAFVLADTIGSAYKTLGYRLHHYPAHPAFVRSFDRSKNWALIKKPGTFSPRAGDTSTARMGGRPCAVFRYVGDAMEEYQAKHLIGKEKR